MHMEGQNKFHIDITVMRLECQEVQSINGNNILCDRCLNDIAEFQKICIMWI